jgi:hypothetical protein
MRVSRDFDTFFTRLVTDSLSRSADTEARHGGRVEARLAERRSVDRRRIVQLLDRDPDAVRSYLATRRRAHRARGFLWVLGGGCAIAAASLALAARSNGISGAWVGYSDAALIACAMVACFTYVALVSAQAGAARRLRILDEHHGPERRAGADRRKRGAGYPPAGKERRSGVERRALLVRSWME